MTRRLAAAATAAVLTLAAACSAASAGAATPPRPAVSQPSGAMLSTPAGGSAPSRGPSSPTNHAEPSPGPASVPVSASVTASAPSTDPAGSVPVGPVSSSAPPASGFTGSSVSIDADLTARLASSWRAGCPVPLADLRYLTLTYRGFDGADHTGELVVAASVADAVLATFKELYQDGYPIASMRLVDDFGGDDDASMAANNTSAFNCRPITGGGGFSEHSFGTAIDVNPVQNPYVSGSTVLPAAGRPFVDRPLVPGVIHDGDPVVQAFAAHGMRWGGDWRGPIDYQHFSVSGR